MSAAHIVIAAVALLSTACRANAIGPPDIVLDRTACSHCGMFVSELSFAGAYRAGNNAARIFDDLGCMLEALRAETASPITVWVQDTNGAGWLNADEAIFVASPRFKTPMGGGILAYADHAAAEKAAATHRDQVTRSWRELMTANGDTK